MGLSEVGVSRARSEEKGEDEWRLIVSLYVLQSQCAL